LKFRLSRPCYDKPWRCPGWAGGGLKLAKKYHCENGRMTGWEGDQRWPQWRFQRCTQCSTVTLPFALRRLDPTWIAWRITRWWETRDLRAIERRLNQRGGWRE